MSRIRFVLYDYVSISIYHIINRCRWFLGMDLYEIWQEMAQRIVIISREGGKGFDAFPSFCISIGVPRHFFLQRLPLLRVLCTGRIADKYVQQNALVRRDAEQRAHFFLIKPPEYATAQTFFLCRQHDVGSYDSNVDMGEVFVLNPRAEACRQVGFFLDDDDMYRRLLREVIDTDKAACLGISQLVLERRVVHNDEMPRL